MTAIASLLLATVFLAAAVAKLRAPAGLRAALDAARLPFAALLSVAVPAAELAAGLWLLSGAAPRLAAVGALCLLGAFSAVLLRLRATASPPSCGCFGERRDGSDPGAGLVRNGLLAVAALALLLAPLQTAPLDGEPAALAGRLTVVMGVLCLWACLVALRGPRHLQSEGGSA